MYHHLIKVKLILGEDYVRTVILTDYHPKY